MARTSTKVFVFEVMGRHAGWIAAAAGLAGRKPDEPPHIILFPEIPFDRDRFLERVKQCVGTVGYCVVVVSEGAAYPDGKFLAEAGTRDAFGHAQLGGVGPVVADMIRAGARLQVPLGGRRLSAALGSPHRLEGGRRAGLCRRQGGGRAGRQGRQRGDADHRPQGIPSPTNGRSATSRLAEVANREKKLPREYITEDGFGSRTPADATSSRWSPARPTRPTATACPICPHQGHPRAQAPANRIQVRRQVIDPAGPRGR